MSDEGTIRLACMSLMWGFGLPNAQMPAWVDDVAAAGYEGVATFDDELNRFVCETDFVRRLGDRGLALASVDFMITDDASALRRVCEQMASLGCEHLVTIGGLSGRNQGLDLPRLAELLNRIGEIALAYGIRACYHNHTGQIAETLEETEQLLRLTDPARFFGFLDIGHATKDFRGHPEARRAALFLERNWDRVDFLEFKDWRPQTKLGTEVGAGRTDYAAVFRMLKQRGYRGWITVEQNSPTPGKSPLESARSSREFIRKELDA